MRLRKAPAKVNLFLNLLHPRPDGYHEVCFLMQTVALFDTLTFTLQPEAPDLRFTCNLPDWDATPQENLIVQAYHRFFEATGLPLLGLYVHLEKQIPLQAGLGGGSSDAACMLSTLQELTGIPLSKPALQELAVSLGSDVPFFLHGGTALATGRGEIIQPLKTPLPPFPLLLIKPRHFGISTPKAYQSVVRKGHYHPQNIEPVLQGILSATRPGDLTPWLWNDFEAVLFEEYPLLQDLAARMQSIGIPRPFLCGSGPTMAGFLEDTPSPQSLSSHFPPDQYQVFSTRLFSQ